jgi:hypothetical protein
MDNQVWSPSVKPSLYLTMPSEIAGACKVHQEKITNALKILVRKCKRMTPLWRSRHRQEGNINITLKGKGCVDVPEHKVQ